MNQLPARKRIRLPRPVYRKGNVFSITIGTFQRYPWFMMHRELCQSAVQVLHNLVSERGTKLYAWCIMPDHIHLLLTDDDIVDFVRYFKGRIAPKVFGMETGRRLWQRSFYDHALRKEESLSDVALYIWHNPVRKGLVDSPLDYLWSGSEVWDNWRQFFARR